MMDKNPALKNWMRDKWLGKALPYKDMMTDSVARSGGLKSLISKFPGGGWGLAGTTAATAAPFLMGDEQDTLEEVSGEVSRGEGIRS